MSMHRAVKEKLAYWEHMHVVIPLGLMSPDSDLEKQKVGGSTNTHAVVDLVSVLLESQGTVLSLV